MRGPFAPVRDSRAKGGPWILPGVLIALALAMSVFVVFGVVLIVLLLVWS